MRNEKFEKAVKDGSYDKAIKKVLIAYSIADYDRYEELIEYYADKFDVSYDFFEGACIDCMYLGCYDEKHFAVNV